MRPLLLAAESAPKFTPWFLIAVAALACWLLYTARRSGCDFLQWEGGCVRVKVAGALLAFVALALVLPAIAIAAIAVPALGVALGIFLQRRIDRRSR
jgi:hypothetical protein